MYAIGLVLSSFTWVEVLDWRIGYHIDLAPDDQAAEVARLEALGARQADVGQGDVSWRVMADPEGNEFCVLTARE
jgi:hypothetical protein